MISKGATTSWERWDTDTQDGGMNGESQKILSGNFEAWCYQTLGGINYDPAHPGFKHVILKPQIVGNLTHVNASHVGPYGKIESRWEVTNGVLHWHVVVPPNTTATAHVPSSSPNQVFELGRRITAESPLVELQKDAAIIKLGSGTYEFTAPFVQ
jgi:alpha-L-rhamnosidase